MKAFIVFIIHNQIEIQYKIEQLTKYVWVFIFLLLV
jgi:hypothetical protein